MYPVGLLPEYIWEGERAHNAVENFNQSLLECGVHEEPVAKLRQITEVL